MCLNISNAGLAGSSQEADDVIKGPVVMPISNLSPDILNLLEKLPDGDIEGVVYRPSECSAIIRGPTPEAVDQCVSRFQSVYQKTFGQLKAKTITHDPSANTTAVSAEVAKFNATYEQCVFVYSEKDCTIKLLSNSARQFDQAQNALTDQVERLNRGKDMPPGAGWGGGRPSHCYSLPLPDGRLLTLKQADLVAEDTEVIVNAANDKLKHWGGVAGALNDATQGALQRISDEYVKAHGPVQVGGVAVTRSGGGALKCRSVYHTVGPDQQCSPKDCKVMIAKSVKGILATAERYSVKSLALPAISTGVFGVDKALVAQVIIDTILTHQFTSRPPVLGDIRIVIIDSPTFECFAKYFNQRKKECLTLRDSPSWTGKLSVWVGGFNCHRPFTVCVCVCVCVHVCVLCVKENLWKSLSQLERLVIGLFDFFFCSNITYYSLQ